MLMAIDINLDNVDIRDPTEFYYCFITSSILNVGLYQQSFVTLKEYILKCYTKSVSELLSNSHFCMLKAKIKFGKQPDIFQTNH